MVLFISQRPLYTQFPHASVLPPPPPPKFSVWRKLRGRSYRSSRTRSPRAKMRSGHRNSARYTQCVQNVIVSCHEIVGEEQRKTASVDDTVDPLLDISNMDEI